MKGLFHVGLALALFVPGARAWAEDVFAGPSCAAVDHRTAGSLKEAAALLRPCIEDIVSRSNPTDAWGRLKYGVVSAQVGSIWPLPGLSVYLRQGVGDIKHVDSIAAQIRGAIAARGGKLWGFPVHVTVDLGGDS